ncbi:MAG: cation-transporting P-type ATPase [Candidatus Promineifilaceae bacterium]|nr:cation-transporting P-type ATPase [Candidatus Promineifilaceae bacterium]
MTDSTDSQAKWYALTTEAVAQQLKVDPAQGLSSAEAQQRLQQYGPNQLAEKKKEPGWRAFLRQYGDLMQIILLVAAVVNQIFTGELSTTLVLLGLTIFNALLGLRGEAKAAASLAALAGTMKSITRVRRDGEAQEIDPAAVVQGDVVLFEAGDVVPADGRLFVTATLEIEEAALTGESVASPKNSEVIDKEEVPLGDRHNMAFMNTSVTRGRGEMMVTTTGMGTEMGHIADLLNKTEADKTPLQKQLDRLTMIIAALAGLAFLIMIILGVINGEPLNTVFISGVALAISAIPTGLPAVVTTMYSMGTRALAAQGAIVKRLPSVETLGSVSAICSDKTGTLTLNKMTAVEFTIPGQNRYRVTGEGYGTAGELQLTHGLAPGRPWQKATSTYTTAGQIKHAGGADIDLTLPMLAMALCADARLDGENLIGDPTEGALIVLAEKGGISVDDARQMYPRIAELPFDSDYKFMATFHNMTDAQDRPVVRAFVKGAPDVLIARGGYYWMPDGEHVAISDETRHLALEENDRIAEAGERVMVVASRDFDPATFDPQGNLIDLVQDLALMAMVGIVDPPRAEAKDAIAKCHSAGIEVRMITGDHAVTAAAIGHKLGIEGRALTGAEFAAIPDEQLKQQLGEIGVVARVAPEDKIRLVHLLQEKENIVAMTGDGVNDAPALKKADIGVAMGITGTEVSKGAAVMILTDDNFATIVKAVEFGRHIYNNLFNFVRFQMEMLVAFISSYLLAAIFLVLGGTPFAPLVVIFLNFFITVPVAIALGFDEPAEGLMAKKPRPLKQPILSRSQWVRIAFMGILIAIIVVYLESLFDQDSAAIAASMGFVAFALLSVAMGLSARSEVGSAFNRDIFHDLNQVLLFGLSLLVTILATELGFLQRILGTTSLSANQWLICIALAFALLLVDEAVKLFLRRRGVGTAQAENMATATPKQVQ